MATQFHIKKAAEVLAVGVDFTDRLVDGDLLTGTPTVAVAPSGLTAGTAARNSDDVTILWESVPANQAVLFEVSDGTPLVTYTLSVTAVTVSGQTLVEDCTLRVV